jgi:hypothetical protein
MELSAFVKEVESASKQELEEAERDLYGLSEEGDDAVVHDHDDSDNAVTTDAALRNLQVVLDSIDDKDEYNRAIEICPNYVNSEEFRVMFLRSEDFDATVRFANCEPPKNCKAPHDADTLRSAPSLSRPS